MELYEKVCKNRLNLSCISSKMVREIALSPVLMLKIKVLILLEYKDILSAFHIDQKELNEFKENFFNIDPIIALGRLYVIDYLESTGQTKILEYYLKGIEYTKSRFGLTEVLDQTTIYSKLLNDTLLDSLDEKNLETRLKCIRTLKMDGKTETMIDKISDRLKGIDL